MVDCFNTPELDVFEHMAMDEILAVKEGQTEPVLRFFNWGNKGPAATFGYAQQESLVLTQIKPAGIAVYTRRPTGGGIVLHKDDLTFSLIFSEYKSLRPMSIYSEMHQKIKAAFAKNTKMSVYDKSSEYRPTVEGAATGCFVTPVKDDLLGQNGEKVLGGAIRRFGARVLYQGSLQLPAARTNADYKMYLQQGISDYLGGEILIYKDIDAQTLAQTRELANKYRSMQWIGKF